MTAIGLIDPVMMNASILKRACFATKNPTYRWRVSAVITKAFKKT